MVDFLTSHENLPFSVALAVMFIIALLEGVGALVGAGLLSVIGNFFPDADVDVNGPDMEAQGTLGQLLSWLRVGQVPVLVLIIVFLVGFGITGLLLQKLMLSSFGFLLPAPIAAVPAFVLSLPFVRGFGGALNAILPKDETSAVSKDTFIGRIASITLGESKNGHPAQGKVKDSFGKHHYIMIEPDNEGDSFMQGEQVLIIKHDGIKFYAIAQDNALLRGDE